MALTNNKYSALPKRSYIQGFWRMEETSGTRYDLSDNHNNLTDNNTVGYGAGKIGNAADFERNNSEYLSISDASQTGLDITGEISAFAWIKLETKASVLGSPPPAILGKYNTVTNGRSYAIYIGHTDDKIGVNLSPNGSDFTTMYSSSILTTATWYHVGFTLNQTTDKIQIYLNGSADGSSVAYTGNIYNSATAFTIGTYYYNSSPSRFIDGLIDEAIIWNTCLTADEIADVYAITSEDMYGKKLGILAWWFCKDSWEKHDKIWKPKILKPEFEI